MNKLFNDIINDKLDLTSKTTFEVYDSSDEAIEEGYKNTNTWKLLCSNPAFETIYNELMKRHKQAKSRFFSSGANTLTMGFTSPIYNRELNCQNQNNYEYSISIDKDGNLTISLASSTLRSNYGYSFDDTIGGVLDTHYSYDVYDSDGIELSYQNYADSFTIDKESFDNYKKNAHSIYLSEFERKAIPNLAGYSNCNDINNVPYLEGKCNNPRYIRRMRQEENLGLVYETSYSCNKDDNMRDYLKSELHFNTFINCNLKDNPLLLHIIKGFPFGLYQPDNDKQLKIFEEYVKTGLNEKNYYHAAKTRFIKELEEEKSKVDGDEELLAKYNLMIDRLDNKRTMKNRTR